MPQIFIFQIYESKFICSLSKVQGDEFQSLNTYTENF